MIEIAVPVLITIGMFASCIKLSRWVSNRLAVIFSTLIFVGVAVAWSHIDSHIDKTKMQMAVQHDGGLIVYYSRSDEKGNPIRNSKYAFHPYRLVECKNGNVYLLKYKSILLSAYGGYSVERRLK